MERKDISWTICDGDRKISKLKKMKKVAEIGAEKRKEDFKIDKASATALCCLCKKQKVCFML